MAKQKGKKGEGGKRKVGVHERVGRFAPELLQCGDAQMRRKSIHFETQVKIRNLKFETKPK